MASLREKAGELEREVAELRRRLAERDAELAEAVGRETASTEVLRVINGSAGDLTPVFDAMLERAMRLCEAAFGSFAILDAGNLRAVAHRDVPAELIASYEPIAWPPRPGGHLHQIASGAAVVPIEDFSKTDAYRSRLSWAVPLVDKGGARTAIWVALRKEQQLLGVLVIYRQEVRPFTDKQIALLQNFATQAVIAMENARLITETREALEQQTATAEVLQVINSSPGDLTPVFDAMLEKALHLCAASDGGISTYDGDRFQILARRGATSAFSEFMRTYTAAPAPDSGLGRILSGERVVHIVDIAADEAYRRRDPLRVATVELNEARTCLWVALRKDARLLGVLNAFRREVDPFSDKQIALLQNFAAQAVIAMENARLLTETREALEQQTATAEVLQVINSSPGDLAPVFDAILEKAHTLCNAPQGAMFLSEGSLFRAVATRGMPERFADRLRQGIGPDAPVPSPLIAGERFVHIPDMADIDHPTARMAVEVGAARSLLAVPLRRGDALFGMIVAGRREIRPYSDKELALLQNFASQAVIAIENARLLNELRDRTHDLQQSLEYQTATSDVLKVISKSDADLNTVMQTVLSAAAKLCECGTVTIFLRRDDRLELTASNGVSAAIKAELAARPVAIDRRTVSGRAVLTGEVIHIEDVKADPDYDYPLTAASGIRTMLAVPFLRDSDAIGSILLARRTVQPFTAREIELVCTFAEQAVIAIENARLLGELRQRTEEVAELNRGLEVRVAEQVDELGRVGKLKRFLAPQLAELIVSEDNERVLESHRREIVVVFCDLRGFTAFAETAEPEEVLDLLREYHAALGPLVSQYEGTLDHFSGDGIMVFFNDPVPCPDPAERAVKMAVAMRIAAASLIATWRERDRDLGFGVGIAQGYATLGQIGFADRSDYTAIGTVCNLAARLCAEARHAQILLSGRVAAAVRGTTVLEELGSVALKGITQPVSVFNVLDLSAAGASAEVIPLQRPGQQPR